MDELHYCPALFFCFCDCSRRRETTLSLTTKLAIIRGLGMSPTSRFRKSGRRPGLAERSICIYRCPACQFASRLTLFAIVTIIENAVVSDFIRGKSMSYLSILETAKKWGISKRRIQVLCSENRIPGAMRIGNYWAIPEDAEKPKDARVKSGRYIKKQSEEEEQV